MEVNCSLEIINYKNCPSFDLVITQNYSDFTTNLMNTIMIQPSIYIKNLENTINFKNLSVEIFPLNESLCIYSAKGRDGIFFNNYTKIIDFLSISLICKIKKIINL
jgi:hypothetical protein